MSLSRSAIKALKKKRSAFTMIEAMIAVAILGLVATASLKLIALSSRGLSGVRDTERLIAAVSEMKILLTMDPLNSFGVSGDIEWQVTEEDESLWVDERMSALGFDTDEFARQKEMLSQQKIRWRELEIKYNGTPIVIFLPYSREAAEAASKDSVSDTRSGSARTGG